MTLSEKCQRLSRREDKGKVLCPFHWAERALGLNKSALNFGFCSMKRLGASLLRPGWDASPSQIYPQLFC